MEGGAKVEFPFLLWVVRSFIEITHGSDCGMRLGRREVCLLL
jgi:hypothetical protein